MWVDFILQKQTKFIHICLMYLFIDNEFIIRGGIRSALNKDVLPLPDSKTVLSIFFLNSSKSMKKIWSLITSGPLDFFLADIEAVLSALPLAYRVL